MATMRKDIELLKLLVESGANVDIQDEDGQTILHLACIENLEGVVRFLHGTGANPNMKDKEERTPIHLATERGHAKIVDMLTEKFKASIHLRSKVI